MNRTGASAAMTDYASDTVGRHAKGLKGEERGMIKIFIGAILALLDFTVTNENFIIHAYKSADRYFVKKFLEDGLRPVIAEIVDEKAAGREISESDRKFISDVFESE